MSAYRRRFSYLDRVRFRRDVSRLCRRINVVFYASIVSVSVTTYRFWRRFSYLDRVRFRHDVPRL